MTEADEKISVDPGDSSRSGTRQWAFKKNSLIDGIKSNRQINKSKTVDLLMIHGLDDVIMHRKKSSFSKMMLMWADWNELSKLSLDRYSENLVWLLIQ
jgi:hypothetical protein